MIFSELDHRMSVVLRWSVVETIRKQNLSTHSYNVAIMADRIARRLSSDLKIAHAAVLYALYHDKIESVTGDFPSYMKPHVDEQPITLMIDGLDEEETNDGSAGDDPLVRFIVKSADYIDACIFLRMEISLGNRSVSYHLRHLEARFRRYVEESQGEVTADAHLVYDWYQQDVVDGLFGGNGQYVSEIDGFPK